MTIKLESDRLIIRELKPSDAPRINELLKNKNHFKYTSTIPFPYKLKYAKEFIAKSKKEIKKGESYDLAVIEKDSGLLIGIRALRIDKKHNKGTSGCWIGYDYRRRGYGNESLKMMMKFAFKKLKLNKMVADIIAGNTASLNNMKKAGFKEEGFFRKDEKSRGKYIDLHKLGVLRSEYQKLKH